MASRPKDLDTLVGDEDRERATQLLQDAYANGRLSHQQLDRCLELVLSAETHGQLDAAVAGLPERSADKRFTISAMSGLIRRRGRWKVPAQLTVASSLGGVYLDFSRAQFEGPAVDLEDVQTGLQGVSYKPGGSSGSGGPRFRIHGTVGMRKLTIRHARWR